MKMKIKFYAFAILAIACTTNAVAQSSATATTTATLVTPISISKVTDMNFGTIASSATAGTAVLSNADVATATGGVSLPGGTPTSAQFTVTGEGTSAFSISLPTTVVLTGSVSGTLTVDTFTDDLGATSALVAGTKTVKVGATLNVPANTVAGTYSNTSDLAVTVNYN